MSCEKIIVFSYHPIIFMKIFDSFDTKLDEKELSKAIIKNWQGMAILTKKHWRFLLRPLGRMFLALIAFWALICIAYYLYYENNLLTFWISIGIYSGVTLLRIIHSLRMIFYDIKHNKVYYDIIDAQTLKPGKFERYMKHSIISIILQWILLFSSTIVAIFLREVSLVHWSIILLDFIVNTSFIALIFIVLSKIIDYEMDFNIFTPDQFTIYRQYGLLKAESTSIAASTIKMVREKNSGFWWAFWWYGRVSIHPEGGVTELPPVTIRYVTKPKILVKKLNEFIEKSKKKFGNPMNL